MLNLLAVNLGAIVDVVALIIIGLFAVRGFFRGFVKTFFSVFGSILALLFAVLLASKMALFLENKFSLVQTISNGLSGTLTGIFGDTLMNTTLEQASEDFLNSFGVGGFLANVILSFKADSAIPYDTTLNQIICPVFAYYVVLIISVIALFIIFKIIFFIIGDLVKKLHKIKLVKITDKTLGAFLGLITGLVVLDFVIMITGIIPLAFVKDINFALTTSPITGTLNKISVFNLIMNAMVSLDIPAFIKSLLSTV